jgi:hypothetical protein
MMLDLLTIEVEPDDDGFHAVIIEIGTDAVLYVSNTFASPEDAERSARDWLRSNQ